MKRFRCAACRSFKPLTQLAFRMRQSGNEFCKPCEPAVRLNRIAQRYGEEETLYTPLHGS